MIEYPFLWKELSFRLKNDTSLEAIVSAFSKYFDDANYGWGNSVTSHDLDAGRIKIVAAEAQIHSRWTRRNFQGYAFLVFRTNVVDRWNVTIFISTYVHDGYRMIEKQLDRFFKNHFPKLVELERENVDTGYPSATETVTERPDFHPLKFCDACGATIAIADSSYCWNCGTKVASAEGALTYYDKEESGKTPSSTSSSSERSCTVCKLGFRDGELLAWCPRCGRAAHRAHLLEWLHVKDNCPACGQHLEERELAMQLSEAHLETPRRRRTVAAIRKRRPRR